MENQNGTVDRMVRQLADPPNGFGVGPTAPIADPQRPPSLVADDEADGDPEAAVAGSWSTSLTGSLSVFSVPDILSMLATTGQTGELEAVGDATEGRVWLEGGEIAGAEVGSSTTVSEAVFELACATEGWFSFTAGFTASGPFGSNGGSTGDSVAVMTVLAEVGPRVDEWRAIRELLPLEAVVTLSPEPPGDDVRIRNDQWRVLTKVGTSGHSVRVVLDMIGGDQIAGLRALRDLHSAGLVDLEPLPNAPQVADSIRFPSPLVPVDDIDTSAAPSPLMVVSADSLPDDLGSVPPPSGPDPEIGEGDRFESLAEVAIMPPPIAGDPWAPVAAPDETGGDGMA